MTWDEFEKELDARGLLKQEFAIQVSTTAETVSRWRRRKRGIPRWVDFWMKQNPPRRRAALKPAARSS